MAPFLFRSKAELELELVTVEVLIKGFENASWY